MQTQRLLSGCVAMLWLLTYQPSTFAQSANAKAIDLFNRATAETDVGKKIELYSQALELDSEMVEAHFNLGLAYRQIKDFASAEIHLKNAYNIKRGETNTRLKAGILYHLAGSQRRLGKLKEAEESLREANRVARDRELQSNIIFDLGLVLHEQKRYEDAIAELRAGQERFKDNRTYFENMIKLVENDMNAHNLDNRIDQAIATGDLKQAQALAQQLKNIKPNHAGLEEKITVIDSLVQSRAKGKLLEEMHSLAEKHSSEGDLEKAISTYEILLQNDPDYPNARNRIAQLRQKNEEAVTQKRVADEYATGLEALSSKNWTRAIIAFESVLELQPAHPDAARRLEEANRGLESESTETIIRQYYLDGVNAMNNKNLGAALASFEKAHSLNPNYKDVSVLIDQINRSYKPAAGVGSSSNEYFNSLYDQAVTAMNEEEWMQAVLILEKLRLLAPDDPNVLNLMIQAKEKQQLTHNPGDTQPPQPKYSALVLVSGGVVALLVIPLVGLMFSPSSRARFNYLRGNYVKAARIYERLIAKHPERLKYYPTLANIYLMLGRNDERALKVFKMIIDLNLAKQIHQQINTVLSQKYLSDGRADEDDAITLLENELRAAQQNQIKADE